MYTSFQQAEEAFGILRFHFGQYNNLVYNLETVLLKSKMEKNQPGALERDKFIKFPVSDVKAGQKFPKTPAKTRSNKKLRLMEAYIIALKRRKFIFINGTPCIRYPNRFYERKAHHFLGNLAFRGSQYRSLP